MKIESHHLLTQLDVVSNDQCQAARLCMRRLRELGYRRIGLATARDDESRLQDNFSSGVLVEQAELPESECVPPLLFDRADVDTISARVVAWIKEHSVDAVMSNWHELIPVSKNGESPLFAATSLRVPQDVAYASLDLPTDSMPVAGIVQNHRLVGMRAMEQLSILVKTYHRGAPENASATYVPGFWRDGPTAPRKSRRN